MLKPMQEPVAAELHWEQYVELCEDDKLSELIDGVLVEKAMPGYRHEHIVAEIIIHLGNWARARRAGRVLGSGYKVRISDRRGVMPDVQFLSAETAGKAGDKGLAEGRPELAVEVLSPSNRSHDRVRKLGWYASIGVPEYWIVDPEARTIERLVLAGERYTIAQAETEGVFRPESFPGLEIPLDELWS
jgi:Uma2 family endonuclease